MLAVEQMKVNRAISGLRTCCGQCSAHTRLNSEALE
jgi:hypothetical protein